MKRISILLFSIIMILVANNPVSATLIVRGIDEEGYQLIYDTDLDITWYDFTFNGTWDDAMSWASNLSVTFYGITYDDWRLPSAFNSDGSGPCTGEDCSDSEMGHLYYIDWERVAWNTGPDSFPGPFINVSEESTWISEIQYWTSTEDSTDTYQAWGFDIGNGIQNRPPKEHYHHALAVLDGDVAVPVPEPATILLFGLGLIGFAGTARRKLKK